MTDVELVHIPLTQGMSEAADSKMLPNGLFASISDARFLKDGRLGLRKGYGLADAGALPDAFDATARILPSDGKDALVYSNKRMYSMRSDTASAGWITKTRDQLIAPDAPTRRPLFREDTIPKPTACAAYNANASDAAMGFVFIRTTGTTTKELILSIVGYASNREERREVVASSATAEQAHIVTAGNYFCVVWRDGVNLKFRAWDIVNQTWLSAAVNTRTTISFKIAVSAWDSTSILVASYASPNLRISKVTVATGAEGTTLDYNIGVVNAFPAVSGVSAEGVWLAWADITNNQVMIAACSTAFVSSLAASVVYASAGPSTIFAQPTISRIDATNRRVFFTEYNAAAGTEFQAVRSKPVSTTAITGGSSTIYGLSLAGHAFTESGRNFLVAVNGDVLLDKTYFLLDVSEDLMTTTATVAIRAEWARSVAVTYAKSGGEHNLSTVCSPATGQWTHGTLVIARGDVDTSTLYGLDYTALDFNGRATFLCRQAHGHLWASGGIARTYDGGAAYEAGLLEIPQIYSVAATGGGAGGFVAGTYKYVLLHEVVTARGHVLQSGTSAPFSVVLGAAAGTMTVSAKRYSFSQRQPATNYASSAFAIRTRIYRTELNGSTYYEQNQISTGEYSSAPAPGPILLADVLPDLVIIANQRLPTQVGSLLPNATPPPFNLATVGDGRLGMFGLENPRLVRWSKLFVKDEGPHCAQDDTFERPVDEDVTGGAFMDGRWFAFSATSVYETGGDGPDDTGVGTFAPWRKLPGDVGCSNRRSIVETSAGVFFQAAPGQLWIIPRGGSAPVWVGQPVRDQLTTNPVIRSAVVLNEEQLVQFVCVTDETDAPASGVVIIYDLRAAAWLIDFPAQPVVSAGYLGTVPARLVRLGGNQKTPRVSAPATAGYSDTWEPGFDNYIAYIKTGAIRPFGPIGFGRIIAVQILGEFRSASAGTLSVDVSYDNGLTYLYSISFSFTGPAIGDQFVREFCFPRQKAEQIVLRIGINSGGTEGLLLNAITLQVAPRAGGPRLPSGSRK